MADEKACGAIIFTNENNVRKYVLLCGHGIYHGYYGFPKGHVEEGETERETALREVKEETGLDVVLYDDFRTVDTHALAREGRPNDTKTNVYFLAEYHDQKLIAQESEVSNLILLDYDAAMNVLQYEELKRELTEAERYLRRMETRMDSFANENDYMLLDNDKYTFFVLKRLLGGENKLLLSDHKRLIICFSCEPYPVWIWNADELAEEELERAYGICKEHNLLDGKHRFNLKYELAEYFIERAASEEIKFTIETNMFAYDNPKPIAPDAACEGELYQCMTGDIDELVEFMDMFHTDVNMDRQTLEEYRKKASQGVENGSLYFWKDASGKRVASCNWSQNGDLAAIGLVYTRREERRKHYAENLVYQVTMIAKNAGFMPMLYTDADYVASNACYEKIGYVLRGKLCTIGSQME